MSLIKHINNYCDNLFKYTKILLVGLPLITLRASILDTPVSDLSVAEKYFLLGEYSKSIASYKEMLVKAHNEHVLAYNMGYLYFLQSQMDSAEFYSSQALKYKPDFGPALFLKALTKNHQDNQNAAKILLARSIKKHTEPELPLYSLGRLHFQQGDFNTARKYFSRALDASDIFSVPYPHLAQCYIEKKDLNKAEKILQKGLELSYDSNILAKLVELYQKTGQPAQAEKYYSLFSFLYPERADKQHYPKSNPAIDYTKGFQKLPVRRNAKNAFLPIGEEVLYNVSLGPLKVGELFTAIQDTLNFEGRKVYRVRFSLDSNPDLAFAASLHSDYISYINRYTKQVELHYLHTRENEKIWDKLYEFDRKNHKFICRTIRKDGHIDVLEKDLPRNAIDGTSILFYARQIVKEKKSERVMTIIDENFVISDINYPAKKELVEVRDKKEECILIEGVNHYKGIVGFTGGFRGWFRDDKNLLPVASDFKIWIGRIKVSMASEQEQKIHKYDR